MHSNSLCHTVDKLLSIVFIYVCHGGHSTTLDCMIFTKHANDHVCTMEYQQYGQAVLKSIKYS